MPKWTAEQQEAIESRGSNLLVSAAAGSGKTAVLVERIIKLVIEDGIDIDRLLVVTFTNAAAGEMRDRVMGALSDKLKDKSVDEAFIRRQISLVHRAHITTVHAFCIHVVRHYFYEIDLDPSFRIGDTAELRLMLESALEDVMEEAYDAQSDTFYNLVESYGSNRSDEGLKELVMKLYFFIQSQPEPLAWLNGQSDNYTESEKLEGSMWMQAFLNIVKDDLNMALEVVYEGMRLCQLPDGPGAYMPAFEADMRVVRVLQLAADEGFHALYAAFDEISYARLPRMKKEEKATANPDLVDAAKEMRDFFKKKLVTPVRDMVLRKDLKRHGEELETLNPVMRSLAEIVGRLHHRFMADKREKNLLDFNDLEHFTIAILKNKDIAADFRNQFKYIFLDEYQDSNIVQETIINSIRRDDNLFLVGDVKQSIYRFRLADPTLFLDKYRTYTKEAGAQNRRIDLARNFRSRPQILHGINYIFERLMSEGFGEMAYDEDAKLNPGFEFMETGGVPLEVIAIDSGAEDALDDPDLLEMKKVELEAHAVAQKAKQLIGTQIYDPKKNLVRTARFKDIVVLLRATRAWSGVFSDVFSEYGLPLFTDMGGGYFESLEVEIFMALLKIIDNSYQDLPLITVLRSPLGGFSVDELIQIRLYEKDRAYYEALFAVAQEESALGMKARAFIEKIKVWRENERIWALDTFLWNVMTESGFYYYAGAMQGGTSRQANLRLMVDKAGQFETLGSGGLFEFIAFFEKLKDSSSDMGTASIISEGEDVIRLMSIHKSKGLEFPIVILAGAGKQFNLRDTYDKVLLHKTYGVGLKFIDPDKRYYSESLPQMVMKRQLKLESLAEEMRILYVALTRAVDRLVIVGSTGRFESDSKRWCRGPSVFNLSSGKSYLDWIMSVLSRHPDGAEIRAYSAAPIFGDAKDGDCSWTVQFARKDTLLTAGLSDPLISPELESRESSEGMTVSDAKASIPEWTEEIDRRLNWEYPLADYVNMPFKVSVSDLKRAAATSIETSSVHIPALVPKPKFLTEKTRKSGAEIGTLHHFVMQHIDFNGDLTETGIQAQVSKMILLNLIDADDEKYIKSLDIARFFETELGRRLLASKYVYREVPFILSKEIGGSRTMVQGIIDCYFEEEDGLVVLDYKTDYTGRAGLESIAANYRVQVEIYTEALQKLIGKPVKGTYLYFFDAGESVMIE